MDLDLDPYGDFSGPNVGKNPSVSARTGGKFQPKAKRGPIKKGLTLHSSSSIHTVKIQDKVALQNKDPSEPHDESVTPLEYAINSVPESDVPYSFVEEVSCATETPQKKRQNSELVDDGDEDNIEKEAIKGAVGDEDEAEKKARPKKFSHRSRTKRRIVDRDEGFSFDKEEEDDDNDEEDMKRTRWSKKDTQLFYEALHQFGTDFSMVLQLFPGRTHGQIKKKYKKEARQHPFRLRDAALTSRAIGHSHFDTVIKRLEQIAEKNNENDEVNDDEEEQVDVEDDNILAQTPSRIHQTEEEFFDWN